MVMRYTDGTHIEDSKYPVEVQLPSGDSILVVLRMCKSRQQIPPSDTFLDDLLLYSCHGSAIKGAVSSYI